MNDNVDLKDLKDKIREKREENFRPVSDISEPKRRSKSPMLQFLKFAIGVIIIGLLFYTFLNIFLQRQNVTLEKKETGIEIVNQQIEASSKSENKTRIKDPLEFYYYLKLETFSTNEEVNHYNLKNLSTSEYFLNNDDLYRFSLNPAGKAYCYVFQFNSNDQPLQIHPSENSFYQMMPNTDYFIPTNDGWLNASTQTGLNTVYIITSFSYLPQLEGIYKKYLKAKTERQSKLYASQLKLYLETLNNASFNGFRKLHLIFS